MKRMTGPIRVMEPKTSDAVQASKRSSAPYGWAQARFVAIGGVLALLVAIAVGAVWYLGREAPLATDVASAYVRAVLKDDGSHMRYELGPLPEPLQAATSRLYEAADWSWLKLGDNYRIGDVWGSAFGEGENKDLRAHAVSWREKTPSGFQEGMLVWMIVRVNLISNTGAHHQASIALRPLPDSPVIHLDPDGLNQEHAFTKWAVVPIPRK